VSILREPIGGILAVNSNDLQGGRLATEHLVSMGHRRIAHLMGDPKIMTTARRLEGYRQALASAGIAVDESLIIKADFDWRGGYAAAKDLLSRPPHLRPTAIFAANDLCAEGAMRAIRQAGLLIPDDVAIVGYDDTWFATMTQPALTSVRMPIEEMGALAVKMLVDRVEGRPIADPQPVLPVTLTVRASCGAHDARAAS
jgi:LacI family transcriptional regulator